MQLLDHLDLGDMQKSTENHFLFGADCFETEENASDIAVAAAAAAAAAAATAATAASAESKASMDVMDNARAVTKVSQRTLSQQRPFCFGCDVRS